MRLTSQIKVIQHFFFSGCIKFPVSEPILLYFVKWLIEIITFPSGVSVTVELTHKNEILQQHQVKTKRKTLGINEEFNFEVATNTSCPLETFGLQFTVYHHDFIRGNEIIGQVRLAMDALSQKEMKHWADVVVSPHEPIEEWHKLHAPLQLQ